MDRKDIENALTELKTNSPKRKFIQSIDLIINLKELNLKKPEHQLELFVPLPHPRGKETRICAIVGPELVEQTKKLCDAVITPDQFPQYAQNKKMIKKLATTCDIFIAQVTFMTDIAKIFGRILGPRGKMPNPKAGCVVPPTANITPLVEKLKKTLKIAVKTQLNFKCRVGTEQTPPDQLAENILVIVQNITRALPQEHSNIKNILLKLTMSKPVVLKP